MLAGINFLLAWMRNFAKNLDAENNLQNPYSLMGHKGFVCGECNESRNVSQVKSSTTIYFCHLSESKCMGAPFVSFGCVFLFHLQTFRRAPNQPALLPSSGIQLLGLFPWAPWPPPADFGSEVVFEMFKWQEKNDPKKAKTRRKHQRLHHWLCFSFV